MAFAVGEQSRQRGWTVGTADAAVVERLAAEVGCPAVIAGLLVARGITDAAGARQFFHPSIDDLHDPMLMLGMGAAVARVQRAVRDGEPILIYGDYDVDGTTATVLLKTAIERIGTKERQAVVTYHVPHRIREGYGMQTGVLGLAAESGIRLVISVDTGIRAFAAAAEAKARGMDLIVTDHHLPDDAQGVPEAVAVLNPAQEGCGYPFKELCGAGVAFKLAQAILMAAAEDDRQREKLRRGTLPSFLKLVAIATIADSVPLKGENRVIAALGLAALRNPVQPGLRALMEVAQLPLNRAPGAVEVAFRLAPRINAAGRMDVASDVVEMFLTKDAARGKELATKLDALNNDRRATELEALTAIEERLAGMLGEATEHAAQCIVLDDPEWHRGVLGILASRVVDRTGRPALVLTHEDGQAHGSGRSIAGFHLLNALTAVHEAGSETGAGDLLFTRFGGHAHAVGFSLPSSKVGLLRERMERYGAARLTEEMLEPGLECDAEIKLAELTAEFCEWMTRCEPFGIGNPEPVVVMRGVTLRVPVRLIKARHVCLQLQQDGAPNWVSALGWSRGTGIDWPARCIELGLEQGSRIDVACRVKVKTDTQYGGVELELVDVRAGVAMSADGVD